VPVLTRDIDAFVAFARGVAPDFGPPCARAAFLVAPDGFARATQSAQDNRYMADAARFDAGAACAQHRELQRALAGELPVICFPGDADTPDAVFPNNVFATAPGRLVVGRMRHPVRQREAARADIRGFFRDVAGYREFDLSTQPHACELTGALVIDRARGLGFCGLSERCDLQGAALMHEAFGLRATLAFELAPGEYHTNVVLALLAGRAALLSAAGFADPRVVEAIASLYAPHAIRVGAREHAAFACNAIALAPGSVWMSAAAVDALTPSTRAGLHEAGFTVRCAALQAIEAAGGSLRCCVAEIF
jgi:hypothetical protein